MAILATYEKWGLEPTAKPKAQFKSEYNQIRNRLINSGEFRSTDRNLNKTILTQMGEYPNWEGEVYKMSQGVARPEGKRDASQKKSIDKRNQILTEADELMTAAGYEKLVKKGKRNFKNQDRSGGMALDHEYETQEFGADYERLKKNFAAGVISEKKFKKELNKIIERKPGNIDSNLTLKTESENYEKNVRTRAVVKNKNLREKYKVRDASYTKKMAAFTKSLNKVNLLNGVHAYAKQFLEGQRQGYDTSYTPKNGNGNANGKVNGNGIKINGKGNGKVNGKTNFLSSLKRTKNRTGISGVAMDTNFMDDLVKQKPSTIYKTPRDTFFAPIPTRDDNGDLQTNFLPIDKV